MIYEFLRKHIDTHKESIICDENETITYADLLDIAEKFGRRIKELNIQKIGILCSSNLNTAKAIMACFYAGITAVVLSPRYGEIHNEKIIRKIGLSHLINDDKIQALLTCVKLEEENLTDVVLIMCTSGTTGDPKGAMITYDNLITNLQDIALYFDINGDDKIFITRPLYHCAVLTGEFLISLIKGVEIHFTDFEFNPVYYLQTIKKINANVMCGTPTIMYYLSRMAKNDHNISLTTITVSGECMTETVAKSMRESFPLTDIYNVYGLTEASPRVSYLPPKLFDKHYLSVGIPLKSVDAKIINGELVVKGNNIMKGYYNDRDLTDKIIKNGWLYTGDLAEIDSNGLITIKSRKDDMIIRAGINIYPQEIENILKSDPRIENCLVYGTKRNDVGQKICLKYISSELSIHQISSLCKALLPAYQMPDIIEKVDLIPKNASGKLIRKVY